MKGAMSLWGFVPFIMIIALALLILSGSHDPISTPPADLVANRPDVDDDENAFTAYEDLPQNLLWPTGDKNYILTKCLAGETVDDGELLKVLHQNEEVFKTIKHGLTKNICLAPEINSFNNLLPHIQYWLKSAKLMKIAVQHHHRTANYERAAELTADLISFGNQVLQTPECLIHYLVGIAILDMGHGLARELALDPNTDIDSLQRLASAVNDQNPLHVGLIRALKREYWSTSRMIDDIHYGGNTFKSIFGSDQNEIVRILIRATGIQGYAFHPEQTKHALANIHRAMITNATRSYIDMTPLPDPDARTAGNSFSRIIKPNSMGNIVLGLLTPSVESILRKQCYMVCNAYATQITLAIRRYTIKHGTLPDGPDDLVPLYLKLWPLDPFDGKPFRYSKEKGIIYAVGSDFKDHGGSDIIPSQKDQRTYFQKQWNVEDITYPVKAKAEQAPRE
jgi:hypothetical protein